MSAITLFHIFPIRMICQKLAKLNFLWYIDKYFSKWACYCLDIALFLLYNGRCVLEEVCIRWSYRLDIFEQYYAGFFISIYPAIFQENPIPKNNILVLGFWSHRSKLIRKPCFRVWWMILKITLRKGFAGLNF